MVNNISTYAIPEITTQISNTPSQLYRNTDDKYFYPNLIVLTNQDDTVTQKVLLVDADLTDTGEDTYKDEDYPLYAVQVPPSDTVVLNENDLKGLSFRYGVGGYNSTSKAADSGVLVYINGEER